MIRRENKSIYAALRAKYREQHGTTWFENASAKEAYDKEKALLGASAESARPSSKSTKPKPASKPASKPKTKGKGKGKGKGGKASSSRKSVAVASSMPSTIEVVGLVIKDGKQETVMHLDQSFKLMTK